MPKIKVTVTIDSDLLEELDDFVASSEAANRSQAIEAAVSEKLDRIRRGRLACESAKLEPKEEKALAEEGLGVELQAWPEY